ncbi:MAG: hypothetical protein ACI90V_010734 [Bacillariaceae sp.]|jgi:hypothetical protein
MKINEILFVKKKKRNRGYDSFLSFLCPPPLSLLVKVLKYADKLFLGVAIICSGFSFSSPSSF